jgi:hypothetical protein
LGRRWLAGLASGRRSRGGFRFEAEEHLARARNDENTLLLPIAPRSDVNRGRIKIAEIDAPALFFRDLGG